MRLFAPLLLLLLSPSTVHALECTPVPASAPMAALPGCVHGAPVRQGELILVPRVCHLTVNGVAVERRTVDVRNGETGARVGASSLPPGTLPPAQFVPGAILPGDPPLLVFPAGIAAIDARANRVEVSFEPQGKLVGVARHGDLLFVVESQAPDKQFVNGSLALTVIDQDAGELIGELQVAGTALDALVLRPTQGKGVELALARQEKGKPIEIVAQLRDAAGKSVVKHGVLAAKLVPVLAGTQPTAPASGCALLPTVASALVDRPIVAVIDNKIDRNPANDWSHVTTDSANLCAVVGALGAAGNERTGMAWFDRAGKLQLQAVRCK
jgi:hypothetical protein